MFGNHGLGGLLEEGAHEKSPKCLGGNLGDFGEFCKGLRLSENPTHSKTNRPFRRFVFSFNRRLLFFTAEYAEGVVTQRTVVAWCLIVTVTPRHFGCFVAVESARYRTFDTGSPLAVEATA